MLFGGWQVPRSAVGKLETQESQWCSSSPKGNRLEAQEKLIFPFDSKGRKNLMSQLKAVRQEELLLITGGWAFLFYSGLQLVGWGPPTLGRTICFIQFIDSNVSLMQKHPYRYTQNNVSPNVWAPCDPLSWCIKLTITASFWHPSIFPSAQIHKITYHLYFVFSWRSSLLISPPSCSVQSGLAGCVLGWGHS